MDRLPHARQRCTVNGRDPLYGDPAAQWVVDTHVSLSRRGGVGLGTPPREIPPRSISSTAPRRDGKRMGRRTAAEVAYVFGTLGPVGPRYAALDREISSAMQQYWTNFAKTGNPNGGDLPTWPKFDGAARGYMEFTNDGPAAREGLRRPFCDLYEENVKRLMAR